MPLVDFCKFDINLLTRTTNNVGFTLNWCNLEKMLSLMILPFLLIAVIFTISHTKRPFFSIIIRGCSEKSRTQVRFLLLILAQKCHLLKKRRIYYTLLGKTLVAASSTLIVQVRTPLV